MFKVQETFFSFERWTINIPSTLCNNTEGPNSILQTTAVDLHIVGGGLLVTNKGLSVFPKVKNYQGQLQTLQRVTVLSGKSAL